MVQYNQAYPKSLVKPALPDFLPGSWCKQMLEALVKSLGLTAGLEKTIIDQLSDWQTKGVPDFFLQNTLYRSFSLKLVVQTNKTSSTLTPSYHTADAPPHPNPSTTLLIFPSHIHCHAPPSETFIKLSNIDLYL